MRRLVATTAAIVFAAAGVAACGGSDGTTVSQSTASDTSASKATSPKDETVRSETKFRMAGDPAEQRFRDIGADGSIRYGFGTLRGDAQLDGSPVKMEASYGLDYVKGSGPFRGYWTVTWPSGDLLVFTYRGETEAAADRSSIRGELDVLGGTGAYVGVSGTGSVRGERNGPVGSPVDYELTLDLGGMP